MSTDSSEGLPEESIRRQFTLATAAAATIHATVWSSAAAYAVVLLVMARWPSLRFYAMAAANFSLGLCAAWMWHREEKVSSPGTTGA